MTVHLELAVDVAAPAEAVWAAAVDWDRQGEWMLGTRVHGGHGEGAQVEAQIDVGEVIIQGTVVGNITAKRSIEIHAPGRVKGDLHTPSLQIDKGVIFEGRSFMEQAQQAKAATPAPPKPAPVK